MAGTSARRPIPALVFLLALSLLSGLVWWRVLHRDDSSAKSATTPPASCSSTAARPVTLPKPGAVTVNVLNATNTTGLAKTVATKLQARGFKVGAPDNDPTKSTEIQIRYAAKSAAAARLVQIYLPGSKLVPSTTTSTAIVVSVGSGFKDLATAAQVAAARATKPTVKIC